MGKRARLKKIKAVGEDSIFNKQPKPKEVSLKQRVPKKFTEMMELKELCKGQSARGIKRKLREKYGDKVDQNEKKRRKESQRKPQESYYRYMSRLESAVDVSMKQARTSVQEFPEKVSKQQGKSTAEKKSKHQRLEKMKERQKKIQDNKKEKLLEKERWTDKVEFGEVVMQPPQLSSKPRKAGEVKKPGQRDLLFLKSNPVFSKKPKDSMARTKALKDERERVIEAYRAMKKNKAKGEN